MLGALGVFELMPWHGHGMARVMAFEGMKTADGNGTTSKKGVFEQSAFENISSYDLRYL